MLWEKENDRVYQTLQLINTNLELEMEQYEINARDIYSYPTIFETCRNMKGDNLSNYEMMNINVILKSKRANEKYLHTICFCFENDQIAYGSSLRGFHSNVIRNYQECLEKAKEMNGKGFWATNIVFEMREQTVYNIAYCFEVKDIYSQFQDVGVMMVCVDIKLLDDIYKTVMKDNNAMLFITDADDRIIWTSQKEALGQPADQYEMDYKESRKYRKFQRISDENDWKYTLYVPKNKLNSQIRMVVFNNLMYLVVLLFLFVCCIRILSRNIVAPIQKMTVLTGRIYTPEFEKKMTMTGTDEIGLLANNFLQLKQELLSLIDQIKSSEKKEREQAIMALQAQINPHFLYNTLDTVYWIADENEEMAICDMVQALSELLRYSIGKKNTTASIKDELHNTQNYVYLQKMRFENLFEVEYDISEVIYKYSTFKLILQPFLENCIIHAFCDRTEGGIIRFRGMLKEGKVIFEIEDNGCGMTKRRIEFIMSNQNDHIGVSNICERIHYMYGKEYGVRIDSEIGKGTLVHIEIPAVEFDSK